VSAPSPGTLPDIFFSSAATGKRLGIIQPFGAAFSGGLFVATSSRFITPFSF
jgi:hypothetical protein